MPTSACMSRNLNQHHIAYASTPYKRGKNELKDSITCYTITCRQCLNSYWCCEVKVHFPVSSLNSHDVIYISVEQLYLILIDFNF